MRLAIQVPDLPCLEAAGPWLGARDVLAFQPPRPPTSLEPAAWRRTLQILADHGLGQDRDAGPALLGERPRMRLDRVYFGTEYCRFRYPDVRACRSAAGTLRELGLPGTLVLGPLPEELFAAAIDAVEAFVERVPDAEVVANDWGTAAHLAGLGVEVELGRMLFEVKRMARFSSEVPSPHVEDPGAAGSTMRAQVAQLSQDPWDHAASQTFLASLGAARYQIDLLPQGLQPRKLVTVPRTLNAPWAYVTGGAQCPLSDLRPDASGVERCAQRCLSTEMRPVYPRESWPIVEIWHTVFLLAVAVLPSFLRLEGVDRLLLHPQIPA